MADRRAEHRAEQGQGAGGDGGEGAASAPGRGTPAAQPWPADRAVSTVRASVAAAARPWSTSSRGGNPPAAPAGRLAASPWPPRQLGRARRGTTRDPDE